MTELIQINPTHLALEIQKNVNAALQEDLQHIGDLTAHLIDSKTMSNGRIISRESGVFCGRAWTEAAFRSQDPKVELYWHKADGDAIAPDDVIVDISGNARALLTAERTALNFIQLLSGVATKTREYTDAIAGTKARIVDTRKTIPGLRLAQKYAVTVGGGTSHRLGLYDAVLIKENHIMAAGSITAAIEATKRQANRPAFIEVEVETHKQLLEALRADVTMILLDNMSIDELETAVFIMLEEADVDPTRGAVLEASGNVSLDNIYRIAKTGVERISIGALTKHVHAIDYSMRFIT